MPYLGRSSNFGVRSVFHYLPSAGDTSVSGADADGKTLAFADGNYIDVYLNGVKLKTGTDYNTTTANTIAGLTALASNDEVTVVVYDAFSLATGFETLGGTFGDDITFNKDGVVLNFGADSDVTITHDPDDGLIFKSAATGDDNPFLLTLQTGETDIAANDVIGAINFQAPDEGTGTDAILVAAGIEAVSEGDFSSSSNATKLVFKTGSSETATEKMSLSSAGLLTISDDLVIGDGKTIGSATTPAAITIASNGLVTISRSDNAENLSLVSTDADASVGPTLRLDRQSASAADGDLLGKINFVGHNDAGTPEDIAYAGITAIINDASDGTEDGKLAINTIVAGTERSRVFIDASETVFNEDSIDVDFRVESNGRTHALFVDAADNSVLFGDLQNAQTNGGTNSSVQIEGTDATASLSVFRNGNNANGSAIFLGKSRGTSTESNTVVQDGDEVGKILFVAADGTDRASLVGGISCQIDTTPGANDTPGRLTFSTTANSANTIAERMRINEEGVVMINTTTTSFGNEGVRIYPTGSSDGTLAQFMNDDGGIAVTVGRGGSDGMVLQFTRGSTEVGGINVTSSGSSLQTSSDYRLKENVNTEWDATTRLKKLKPSRFSWIVDKKSEPTHDGFLAHEVMDVVPEAIVGTKDEVHIEDNDIMGIKKGDPVYQSIDQSKLVPLLTKALQEAISEIETLKTKVTALEGG